VITVTGSIHARPDTVDELEALGLAHVDRSRKEPGYLLDSVHRDVEDPLHLVFLEQWLDADALRAHAKVQASVAFVRRITALSAESPQMAVVEAENAWL
jgi:quinol monooxygenase YgiN